MIRTYKLLTTFLVLLLFCACSDDKHTAIIDTNISKDKNISSIKLQATDINQTLHEEKVKIPIKIIVPIKPLTKEEEKEEKVEEVTKITPLIESIKEIETIVELKKIVIKEKIFQRYTRDDINQTVTDHNSSLMWQDDIKISKSWIMLDNFKSAKYYDTRGDTATSYCNELTLGGFYDWRLPRIEEFRTIMVQHGETKDISKVFVNVDKQFYWSSSQFPGFENSAWYLSFYDGSEFGYAKNIHLGVRCVRSTI